MTLFKFLCRRHWLSILLAYLIPVLIGVVIGLLYPTYAAQRKLLEVFKFSTSYFGQEQVDLFSAAGSFTLPFQHPLCLIGHAIVGGIAALGLPAAERGRGALDLLLASPLGRRQLVATLGLFSFLSALALGAIGFGSAFLGAFLSDEVAALPIARYALCALTSIGLCFVLGGLALLVSVWARDRGQATITYGVVVGAFFIVDVAARMWTKGSWLAWYTPFGYHRPAKIVGQPEGIQCGLQAAATTLLLGLALQTLAMFWASRRKSA